MTGLAIVHFGVFMGAVMLLNLTPGPDTAYIVGRSLAQGPLAGVWSAIGVSGGCCVHTLASAFGLTALLAASATAFGIIRYVGAAYLIYLGLRMVIAARARPASAPMETTAPFVPTDRPRGAGRLIAQGFITNVTNPKVVLFFLSFFPQFVAEHSEHKTLAFLALGVVFVAMSTVYNCAVALVAAGITRRVRSRPSAQAWIERTVGSLFVALGARLAWAPLGR